MKVFNNLLIKNAVTVQNSVLFVRAINFEHSQWHIDMLLSKEKDFVTNVWENI